MKGTEVHTDTYISWVSARDSLACLRCMAYLSGVDYIIDLAEINYHYLIKKKKKNTRPKKHNT